MERKEKVKLRLCVEAILKEARGVKTSFIERL